jgi:DNA repair exonuclease SbcCD ATPase subunit
MTDNSEIIDLLTAIVSTIESQDIQAQKAKSELVEQLKVIASKTDTVSTNFPKLIETLSNFDSKIASSFDDIQNVSKQLNSVVQQISVAQKALETVRLQASNLNIEQTTTHIRNADAHARQLSEHLENNSQRYQNNMRAATNIAIQQIEILKNQVSTISDSFSDIVSNRISDQLKSEIEVSAKDTAEKLASSTFNKLDSTFNKAEQRLKENSTAFHNQIITTYNADLKTVKEISTELQATAQRSAELYQQREKAYQDHVLEEKKKQKLSLLKKLGIGWAIVTITGLTFGLLSQTMVESGVEKALNYRIIEARLKGLGLQMLPPDLCKNYIPKQAFSQIPAIQTCFQFRNSQKIQTQYGELHVIYK